jgi:hypothetical protein
MKVNQRDMFRKVLPKCYPNCGHKCEAGAMKKWTWQWLAPLGLSGMIFLVATLFMDLKVDEPIPAFYDYPYSDVALARRGDTPPPL